MLTGFFELAEHTSHLNESQRVAETTWDIESDVICSAPICTLFGYFQQDI